jgi:hypothetical protein
MLPEENSRRICFNASDTDSDEIDQHDFWKEPFLLAQQEDDDWRSL